MRLARFNTDRLGLLVDDASGLVDLTDRLDLRTNDPLIEYLVGEADADKHLDAEPDVALDSVRLESPVRRPGKIVAAPANYERHVQEAIDDADFDIDDWFTIEDYGSFLKAPSSIVGPADSVVLPFTDRRVDHEIELAFLMGTDTKDASLQEAWDSIFGYTVLLDITVRGEQDRSSRKSYDSFTVVGPWVVTADAVEDPQVLPLELRVNGEIRQQSSTSDMIYTCGEFTQYASIGTTLETGDLLTTGTPEGVGPIAAGDVIDAEIEGIGSMRVPVEAEERSFEDARIEKG